MTKALYNCRRKMTVRGLITTLPKMIEWQAEESALRVYMTDCARIVTENTAKSCNDGKYLSVRYHDIIDPPPEDTRTPQEIINNICNKLDNL